MEYIPVSTRVLRPPQDDLLAVLDESLTDLREGDIVVISSKVVAIHEGRCLPLAETDKEELVTQEAQLIIPRSYWKTPLTITRHAFVGMSGIDESNGDGYYILLPEDVFGSARRLYTYLRTKHSLEKMGVIISDSASGPFRLGAQGVALGWWGFEPLQNHIGREDLFGRAIRVERSNVVDGIAAGATVVAGEVDECVPVVVARSVPRITYREGDTSSELLVPFVEDTFRVLYEKWLL